MKSMRVLKFVAIISGFLTVLLIIIPFILLKILGISIKSAGSIGIIGGADGPTAVFVTNSSNFIFNPIFSIVCAAVAIVSTLCIIIKRIKG